VGIAHNNSCKAIANLWAMPILPGGYLRFYVLSKLSCRKSLSAFIRVHLRLKFLLKGNVESLRGVSLILDYRYIGVFLIFLLYSTGFASIIPGRSVMVFLGVLCHRGYFSFSAASIVATIAAIVGANIGYILGSHTVGNVIASRERFMFLSRDRLEKGMSVMRQHGAKLIIPAMFVGGFWAFTSLIPGMIRIKYAHFAPVNAVGLVIWVYALMSLGYFGSRELSNIILNRSYLDAIIIIFFIGLFIALRAVIRKFRI